MKYWDGKGNKSRTLTHLQIKWSLSDCTKKAFLHVTLVMNVGSLERLTHVTEALHLYAIRQTSCSSPAIQSAIQQAFSSSDVQASCCQGGKTPHTSFTECIRGEKGLVLYTTVITTNVYDFRTRKIEINRTIRLPFQGHNFKVQSTFRLVGFTARPINLQHHMAVIYDAKGPGQPWTYDDGTMLWGIKGCPNPITRPFSFSMNGSNRKSKSRTFALKPRHAKKKDLPCACPHCTLVQVGPPPAWGNEELAQITKTKSGRFTEPAHKNLQASAWYQE